MKSFCYCVLGIALLTLFPVGCTDDKQVDLPDEIQIHTAGYEVLGNITQAKLWIDENRSITLADNAIVNALTLHGTDRYAAGYINDQPRPTGEIYTKAIYWKNEIPVFLTDGSNSAQATDIVVVEGDVYVCGFEYNASQISIAKYWKNGIQVELSHGDRRAEAHAIAVEKGDVYVCGFEFNGQKNIAKYWKNGNSISLSSNSGNAMDIAIEGDDVYAVGFEFATGSLYCTATYWKNGTPFSLTDGTASAVAHGICISRNKVWMVGYDNTRAVLWDSGQPTYLVEHGMAFGVCTLSNDIYVVGCQRIDGTYKATCWKNGESMKLSDKSSFAKAIAVTPSRF